MSVRLVFSFLFFSLLIGFFFVTCIVSYHVFTADKFRYDLTPRKSSIEVMIQYELEKYAADSEEVEGDDEEEDEEEEEEEGLW